MAALRDIARHVVAPERRAVASLGAAVRAAVPAAPSLQQRLGAPAVHALALRAGAGMNGIASPGHAAPAITSVRDVSARAPPGERPPAAGTAPPGRAPPAAATVRVPATTRQGTPVVAAPKSPAAKAESAVATKPASRAAATPAKADKAAREEGAAGAPPSPREALAPTIEAVHHRAARARKHSLPPSVPVDSAHAAAKHPPTEQTRTASATTVATLNAAATKSPDVKRDDFKAALKKAIEDATPKPKTESEADRVVKSGATDARGAMHAQLGTERDAVTQSIKSAPEAKPEEQHVSEQANLTPEPLGAPPAPVSGDPVVPAPLPPERFDYSSDREPTDQAMAENNVTKEQLEKGNEPEMGATLGARSAAEEHEASAEARYRQSEGKLQENARSTAQATLGRNLAGMHGARALQVGKVIGQQVGTLTKDAAERQRITSRIKAIKDETRRDVDGMLVSMEGGAANLFDLGLMRAEGAYAATFAKEKGGTWTWLTTWGSDWEELIESSLGAARQEYLRQIDVAVDQVADFVNGMLDAAKRRVAQGLRDVETFVNGLEDNVKKFGADALQEVSADFETMVNDIDQRRDSLVDKLTQQYKASYERMSKMEERLREENKSLWQKIYDATVGLIKKILAFKDMLLSILAKAASVILDIISDPIGFLGNLISAVMDGLKNFMANIGAHLKKGLMTWLFGELGSAGLKLPETLDLEGIVSIALQVLGLTYANFRARAVALVGEPVVAAMEKTADVFRTFASEGIPGLWRFIKDKVGDLQTMVLDAIMNFIEERVIVAGITWIIGLLNPASAFFKACKAIYDIVMFFIHHGSEIIDLVNAVIDSIAEIARGSLAAASSMVENALARAIPVAIGFLASLLGLGDVGGTVKKTIEKAQTPVNKAIDWVINLAVKVVKVAGKALGKLVGKNEETSKDDKTTPTGDPQHDAKVAAGLQAIEAAELAVAPEGRPTKEQADAILQTVKHDHPVFSFGTVTDGGDHWIYELTASSHKKHGHGIHPDAAKVIKKLKKIEGVQGIPKLITALGYKLTDSQRQGYIFQAERTLHWYKEGVLKYVELEMSLTSGGGVEVSIFDIVIEEEGIEGKENSAGTLVFIDTKSWQEATRLGQAVLNAKTKAERDEARDDLQIWVDWLATRLNKYRRLGLKVVIEWKGKVPDAVSALRKPASKVLYGSIDFTEIP